MINQKNDLNMITRKLETELPTFHYDDLEISEITTETSWMKLHVIVLFIKDNAQITKELYKDYETGLWYYRKNDGMIISHKDTFNHTIKNLVSEMIFDVNLELDAQAANEETAETAETAETKGKETEESTASEETYLTETAGSAKRKADNQTYNSMCYNCKKFLNGCRGEKNKIYSGCVYKEKMEVRNNG